MQKRMRIGIITRGLTKGGVKRFIFNILKEFETYEDKLHFLIFYNQKELFEKKFDYADKIFIKGKNKLVWDYIKFPLKAKKNKLDVIIYPKNIIPFTNLILKAKKINIIHDLGYFEDKVYDHMPLDRAYMKTFMKLSCKIASKTIAISELTKQDIIRRLNIDPEKIIVIPLAVEEKFKQIMDKNKLKKVIRKYDLNLPFILYCGSLSPRKNLLRTLKAFNKIKCRIPHNFYLTGNKKSSKEETLRFIKENLKERVKILGYVSEQELVALYNLADLFVFPSLYEGFGLPILEAQACGTPVLTSNVTSCPEVAGGSAHLVDPYSVGDMKNGMIKVLKNENYKNNLIRDGFKNIKRFSWKKTAKSLFKQMI